MSNIIVNAISSVKNLFIGSINFPYSYNIYTLTEITKFSNLDIVYFYYMHNDESKHVELDHSEVNMIAQLKGTASRWQYEWSDLFGQHCFREVDANGKLAVKNIYY